MSITALLCAPSVRTAAQQAVYRQWRDSLESRSFRVEMLAPADYARDPWEQLARLMRRVDGVVVLGFRQMEIRHGVWRNGTAGMENVTTVWSSPWVQIEAGMAIASNKPVLAVPERGVSEGVFAPENWTANVFGALAENPRSLTVERWAAAVHKTRALRAG